MAKAVLLLSLLTGCSAPQVWHLPRPDIHPECGGKGMRILRLGGPPTEAYRCLKCWQEYLPPGPVRVR